MGGFSRGGGQALFAAFSHPELFAHVASYSAYLTPQVMERHFGQLMGNPARMDSLYRVKWFGVGRGDFLYADVMRHLDYFREKGISCRTRITDGGAHYPDQVHGRPRADGVQRHRVPLYVP